MNTLLDYLTVLVLAALLLAPALYGVLRERRIDRQLRAAQQLQLTSGPQPAPPGPAARGHGEAPPPGNPVTRVVLPMGGDAVEPPERRTQKSSSRSTVPSTATW
ncbi:hypothetical protein [Streptomyces vinaceus]|uniref:hypothetical protein n=1 Tax=Streptomyces vinaceus TaxID=1960 RepID=UPI00167C367D|nr:hypothetical protein [Streptomyces vinaceus]GHE32223.1 hypothetical protein GCM10017778_13490 [Streptomyces vinaceus]